MSQQAAVQRQMPVPVQSPSLAPGPAASAYARSLIGNLTNLDLSHGPLTPEQVQAWKQDYEKLIKAGAESVPAIREFLTQNLDLDFKSLPNADQWGASSLRFALFDALRQIGNPDAQALSAEAMQVTTNPRELAVLAANLEGMAAGQYREAALAAARVALANAAQDPSLVDVAPLLQVLQQYGGANALSEFQQAANRWGYYAPIALAQLPDGAGIPLLAQMAQNSDGAFSSSGSRFALRMLTELAPQYPDAANLLLERLRNGQFTSRTWMDIASALSGERTFYSDSGYVNTSVPPANGSGRRTWHMATTQQNWQSVNVSANWTAQQVQDQLNLINQIIAANAQAGPVLEATRDALAARLNR